LQIVRSCIARMKGWPSASGTKYLSVFAACLAGFLGTTKSTKILLAWLTFWLSEAINHWDHKDLEGDGLPAEGFLSVLECTQSERAELRRSDTLGPDAPTELQAIFPIELLSSWGFGKKIVA